MYTRTPLLSLIDPAPRSLPAAVGGLSCPHHRNNRGRGEKRGCALHKAGICRSREHKQSHSSIRIYISTVSRILWAGAIAYRVQCCSLCATFVSAVTPPPRHCLFHLYQQYIPQYDDLYSILLPDRTVADDICRRGRLGLHQRGATDMARGPIVVRSEPILREP